MEVIKWILRIIWWGVILILCAKIVSGGTVEEKHLFPALGIWIAMLLLFYFNRFLFRQVLRRGYFIWYFILALSQAAGVAFLTYILFANIGYAETSSQETALSTVALFGMVLLVNLQVTIVKDWFRSVFIEKRLAQTEHQLARVKLNPHFFKNVLNDLYSLVYLKKDEAAEAVVELKDLMEYIIYDADVNYIPLERELAAIQQLVNIQKHRLPAHVSVNYQLFIDNGKVLVPPMMLFPFMENVYRHADLTSEGAHIDVKLRVKGDALMYRVKSKLANSKPTSSKPGGIGISTLENRLYESYGLLGYLLDKKEEKGCYYAKLEIFGLKNSPQ